MSDSAMKNYWQETLAKEPFTPGFYRHYKGSSYVAFATTIHEDTGAVLVHYFSVLRHTRWTRTRENFVELVDGRPRFTWWRIATVDELAAAAFGGYAETRRVFGSPI